jgi:putative membrane protein
MAARAFFDPSARQRATEAVKAVEARTAAEIVIAVRKTSGSYRGTDLGFAAVLSAFTLAFLWFSPIAFSPAKMSLNTAAVFVLAAFASSAIAPLRRLLSGKGTLRANAERNARSVFYEQGILRTTGRTGILVFVSVFERAAVLVPDVGVDPAKLGEPYAAAEKAIQTAVARADFEAFVKAVESLGPALETQLPRSADDVNELSDEVA